jgi:hypothetical protein
MSAKLRIGFFTLLSAYAFSSCWIASKEDDRGFSGEPTKGGGGGGANTAVVVHAAPEDGFRCTGAGCSLIGVTDELEIPRCGVGAEVRDGPEPCAACTAEKEVFCNSGVRQEGTLVGGVWDDKVEVDDLEGVPPTGRLRPAEASLAGVDAGDCREGVLEAAVSAMILRKSTL